MRTIAQKRVYGKRRLNIPTPVLDDGSPAKVRIEDASEPSSVDAMLVEVEAKLHAVRIEESMPDGEESVQQPVTPKNCRPRSREALQNSLQGTRDNELPLETPRDEEIAVKTGVEASETLAAFAGMDGEEVKRKPRRRHKATPRRSSGCIHDEKVNSYVSPILDECISHATSQKVQKFGSWAARSEGAFEVVKIAEGSYGEVYKLRIREELVCKREMSRSKLAKLRVCGEGVFKIVPLRARSGPGSKKFTSVEEIVAEVKLLKLLDPIPGFARFREIHVVQGRFPESFQAAWIEYKNTKDDCWNPDPGNKRVYPSTQLWAILEMDDAGYELEKFSWCSTFQIYDIFWGVAMALARAEEYAMFEVSLLLS
jgi:serine/threonine-protein kinase haspin